MAPAGALSLKREIKFMKNRRPAMAEWRMYGRMYKERLKPLIDEAHKTACAQYDHENPEGGGNNIKRPERITFWTSVAKEQYTKESDVVKRLVEQAVEEVAKKPRNISDLEA